MIVFDAQPLLAYLLDEPGADVVQRHLADVVAGELEAWCCTINLAEIHYSALRQAPTVADGFILWLLNSGVREASADEVWQEAARIKAAHPMPLADAFALATAKRLNAPLLAGEDIHFDVGEQIGVRVERFRE